MDRHLHTRLVACPLCATLHNEPIYEPAYCEAAECWSDGRRYHLSFENREGLRRCTGCDDFYLVSEGSIIERSSDTTEYVRPKFVDDGQLARILEYRSRYSKNLIESARVLYWRYLNDPYREHLRLAQEHGRPAPSFRPTHQQIENMEPLIHLIHRNRKVHWLHLAEIHRELGEFDTAIECLNNADQVGPRAAAIREMAENRNRSPVRYYSSRMDCLQ